MRMEDSYKGLVGVQEYEKRLLKKDHEVKEAQAHAAELLSRLQGAEATLADTSRMLPAPEVQPGAHSLARHLLMPEPKISQM